MTILFATWAALILSIFFILYTYAIYPAVLYLYTRNMREPIEESKGSEASFRSLPSISIVTAVYNGESHLQKKLNNILNEVEYPRESIEWIIVDDGSTDGTADFLEKIEHDTIRVYTQPTRQGKPSALNVGVSHAKHELIVFCDIRQQVSSQAFHILASYFADPRVGAVSGMLEMDSTKGPGLYWKYERFIRLAESRMGSCVGATGALFAIRKETYEPLPKDCLLDDVYTPMQIACKGYAIHLAKDAKLYDQEADVGNEFARKVRTLSGNFQLLFDLPGLLSPRRNPLFFSFFSHKIMRLLCPYALLICFITSLYLAWLSGPFSWFLGFLVGGQVICYGLALWEGLTGKGGRLGRVGNTFVVLNAAAVVGAWRAITRNWRW